MTALNNPEYVREEYASDVGLLGRRRAYEHATGPNAVDVAFKRVFSAFSGENAEELLRAAFADVERHEASGEITFSTRESVVDYARATQNFWHIEADVPEIELPFVVRRRTVVLVAQK